MKKLYWVVILVLLTLSVSAKDISNLEPCNAKEISHKLYENIFIDFDHTYNEWYFSTIGPIEINFDHEQMFHIWDVDIAIDGKQYSFEPRPPVGDPTEKNPRFHADIEIPINDTKKHNVKLTFFMNNVRPVVNQSWYPFDRYEVFLTNRSIKEDFYRIANLKFPEPDIDLINVSSALKYTVKCPYTEPAEVFQPEKLIETKYNRITSGVGIKNKRATNFNWITLIPINKSKYNASYIEFPCDIINASEKGIYHFKRSFFPSKFLFWLLALFSIFLTFYFYFQQNTNFWEKLFQIYVKTSLLIIVAEFAISILPPSRPLTFTLFDSIILWPFVLLLVLKYGNR